MAINAAIVIGLLGGSTFLAMGIALLVLDPPRRGVAGLATYAALVGSQQVLTYVGVATGESAYLALSWPVMGMAAVALALGASQYVGSHGSLAGGFLAIAVAGMAVALWRPDLMLYPEGDAQTWGAILWQLPLFAATAIAAALLEWVRRSDGSPELRRERLYLLLALVPHMAYTSAVSLLVALRTPGAFAELWGLGYLLTFGTCLMVASIIAGSLWSARSRRERIASLFIVGVIAAGFVQYLVLPEFVLFGGALRVLAALLFGYGLLKFGLFGTDLKLKWSLDRGALLAVFGGVFFLVDQAAQFFVSAAFGAIAGIVAAILLLFLLRPLRKATAKLADRVFPGVHPTAEYLEARKLLVYRSAAQAAAKDGVITERERDMLAALVAELQIPATEVANVERDVLASAG